MSLLGQGCREEFEKRKKQMNNGDICVFQIPFNEDVYMVRCECYDSYIDDGLAYGNTYYKNGEEILHAGFGQMIDSLGKAKEALGETLELLKKLEKEMPF